MEPSGEHLAPIHVLVVDDEDLARRNVTALLRREQGIGSVTECDSGSEAVRIIRDSKPELVFLDVQMPGCDGFDVLELLGMQSSSVIIFVTAYSEYALRAFDAGALDYLLKPFDDARFRLALNRARDRIGHTRPSRVTRVDRIVVKNRAEVLFIDVADVDWIEAVNYYACLHVGSDTHVLRRTLLDLLGDLDEDKFMRIHRSTIVNLDQVHALELKENGEYEVVMKSKARLKLSRRFRKPLRDRMARSGAKDRW